MMEFSLWPDQISAHGQQVDILMIAFSVLLFFLVVPVFAIMAYFAVKYHHTSDADRTGSHPRTLRIELSWSILVLAVGLVFFVWAARLYYDIYSPPEARLEIDVVAKQWMWKAQHPGGEREINALHVPVNEPVMLRLNSQDVIHSFYVPALRLKQDVVPGMETRLWFEADKTGRFHLFCAEYCGTEHSAMRGEFVVMEPAAFQDWLGQAGTDPALAAQGGELYRQLGCSGCHEPAGTVRAPTLRGVFGRPVPLADGTTITADERYIRDSILMPTREIVAGYQPVMPSYRNRLDPGDLERLVAYIKSLATQAQGERE